MHFSLYLVSEFLNLYRQEENYQSAYNMYEDGVVLCYDHVWLAALALNCTNAYLTRTGMLHMLTS